MKIFELIENLGLVRTLAILLLIMGAFVDSWKGICRPILMLIMIRYIPPMVTSWSTKKIAKNENSIFAEFVSLIIAAGAVFVVAVLIYYGLKDL